jgi:hypothetical protein
MSVERQYVRLDEHGVMRIGTSRVMLEAIVAGFQQWRYFSTSSRASSGVRGR